MASKWQQSNALYKTYARNLYLLYQNREDVRMFTELLLSLSAITIFGIFAIRPTLVTIASLSTEISSKNDLVDVLDQKIDNLVAAEGAYTLQKTNINLLDTAIPKKADGISYLRQIEGAANRHGVDLIGMNVEDVQLVGDKIPDVNAQADPLLVDYYPVGADSISFSLNANGSYTNIISFLSDIEQMRQPLFADDISIGLTSNESAGDKLLLTISGRIPYSGTLAQPIEAQ